MAACRRISCFAKKNNSYIFKCHKFYSSGTAVKSESGIDNIVVPYRIERSPTDILKALATTISKDYTAPHYKYEDDPFLIPASNITKRSFALSKESGKKAAHYFLEKYPELFKCNYSVPHVKAFDPPIVYTEDNVSSVESLKECITDLHVNNSVEVYNILKQKGVEVSQELKQDLLELLCFYNGIQPPDEDYYEDRYYSRKDAKPDMWDSNGMAERLFKEMEKNNQSYSTMIAGTAKCLHAERAFALYDEMREKGFIGTVEVHNYLIAVVNLINEDGERRWEHAIHLLGNMASNGLAPNLYTMNSLMELVSRNPRWKKCSQLALRVLAEMKNLKIEPSLGTYYHLLTTFCGSDFSKASVLYEIMNEIEVKDISIRHPSDVSFFAVAMEVCWKGTGDKDLAYRIHKLLEFGNNCKLLGNAHSESQYFKCFFRVLVGAEDMDTFMEIYEKYIPNTYTPEPIVTQSIIEAIHFNGSYHHLPKLCSDVLFFEQTERDKILSALMEAAGCMKHEEKVQTDLVNMVWNILQKLNTRAEFKRLPFDWTGVLLGNFLKTFVNGKHLERAWSVMEKLKHEENFIYGYPDKNTLLKFSELCLELEDYEKLKFCAKYAINGCYLDFQEDLDKLIAQMFEESKIDEKQRDRASAIFRDISLDDSSSIDSSSETSSSEDSSSDEEAEVDVETVTGTDERNV